MRNHTLCAQHHSSKLQTASPIGAVSHDRVSDAEATHKSPMHWTCSLIMKVCAMAVFAPLGLIAQAPTSDKNPPPSADSQAPPSMQSSESAQLALKLTNPVASLISIPIQNWFDFNLGPKKDGFRYTFEAQPVYPMRISKDWNLISRTTIPVIYQQNVIGRTTQTGFRDSPENLFLSPVHTKSFIWGAGPIFLAPTGTYGLLSSRKFGMGPTAVVLEHRRHANFGLLANHVWSVAGTDSHPYVSQTYAQTFITYTTTKAWTIATTSYNTYDWHAGRWTSIVMPVRVSKLLKIGGQRISIGAAPRCTVTSPQYAPKGCGLEFTVTPLYPKR